MKAFLSWLCRNPSPLLARRLMLAGATAALVCAVLLLRWPFGDLENLYIPSFFWQRETVRAVCEDVYPAPGAHGQVLIIAAQGGETWRWSPTGESPGELMPGDELVISFNAAHPFARERRVLALTVNGSPWLSWEQSAREADREAMAYIGLTAGVWLALLLAYIAVMHRQYAARAERLRG